MNISLDILESDQDIQNSILTAIKTHLDKSFSKARLAVADKVKKAVKSAIESEPEYQSLISGKLKYELGIPDSTLITNIVSIWVNNIVVENQPIKISGDEIVGGFTINMIKSDYSDVLSSAGAQITDSNTGSKIPWLDWLLLRGGEILVSNYEVKFGANPRSRSGNAIMISSKKDWRMPPEFAGTAEDNWVYRAISKLDSNIPNIIRQELERLI